MQGNADLDAFVKEFWLLESKNGITWTKFKNSVGVDKVRKSQMFLLKRNGEEI